MDKIVDDLDSFKTRFSRFTVRLSLERQGYCAFVAGILFTRSGDIVDVQEFVEGLQQLVDKKRISQEQERALLLTAYQHPSLLRPIQARIFEPIMDGKTVNVDSELLLLNHNPPRLSQQIPKTPPLQSQEEQHHQPPMSQGTVILDQQELSQDPLMEVALCQAQKQRQLDLQSERLARQIQAEEAQLYKQASQSEQQSCQICFENLYEGKWLPLEKCPHIFHTDCMKESFKMNISERKFPLKCPNSECGVEVTDIEIQEIIGQKDYEHYQDLTFKNYIDKNADTVSWCPTADCRHCFFYTEEDGTRFECPVCKKDYCLKCRVEWHNNMTCKEHEINATFNEDDKKFIDFVKGAKFKQCPKCRYWVEKNMGCDHMSCRCGYQFCYKCGGKYGECECVKEAQERMRQAQARAEEKRRKKMEAAERRAVKLSESRPRKGAEKEEEEKPRTRSNNRGTRSRPK